MPLALWAPDQTHEVQHRGPEKTQPRKTRKGTPYGAATPGTLGRVWSSADHPLAQRLILPTSHLVSSSRGPSSRCSRSKAAQRRSSCSRSCSSCAKSSCSWRFSCCSWNTCSCSSCWARWTRCVACCPWVAQSSRSRGQCLCRAPKA